jgi:hypothetical protein
MDSLPATIRLLPTAEGAGILPSTWEAGTCRTFASDGGQYLGVLIRSDAVSTLELGAAGAVTVDPLYDIDYGELTPGARFEVLEGTRRVGFGQIL